MNHVIEEIHLGLNNIGDKGIAAMSKCLKEHNTGLKDMDLGINNIQEWGVHDEIHATLAGRSRDVKEL